MKNGVKLKGGYAGFGEPDPDAWDVELYETILSGDLNGNDVPVANPADLLAEPTRTDNCYHVVTGTGVDATSVLDGFAITAGKAESKKHGPTGGGGMHCSGGASPKISRCTFRANTAGSGGGMSTHDRPELTDCKFIGNAALGGGGALASQSYTWKVTNCVFIGNWADSDGGAVDHLDEAPVYVNCIFSGNTAGRWGGALCFLDGYDLSLINCTFVGNTANDYGGAIQSEDWPIMSNCIAWGNSDSTGTGESAQVSVFDGGEPDFNHCCIQGWTGTWGGTGNFGDDPRFVNADGADGTPGTEDDDLRLAANSPCINAGDNSVVTLTIDLAGSARIVDTVDMGAYEFQGTRLIYVDADASGANNGQSWADAYTNLSIALKNAVYPE